MADHSAAGEQLEQVETLHRRVADLVRVAKEHPERLPDINRGLQDVKDGKYPVSAVSASPAPLAPYRAIKGLIVVGPTEWQKAMRSKNRKDPNPLGLAKNWCPNPAVPYTVEQMIKLTELCKTPEWKTTPVLWLALPNVGGIPTSLVNQYNWWGARHDNLGPGKIRKDTMWSNWFIKDQYDWATQPAVAEPTWLIGYELPIWTTRKTWLQQLDAAKEHGMSISTATQDALMCNLVDITKGKKFRSSNWSRTSTVHNGRPLSVTWSLDGGLYVNRSWSPDDVDDVLGASVQGVPQELDSLVS